MPATAVLGCYRPGAAPGPCAAKAGCAAADLQRATVDMVKASARTCVRQHVGRAGG